MYRDLIEALEGYPVFTVRDIASILDKKRAYAYLVAFRLKKADIIYEIEKGKYTLYKDPFVIASWIVWPSYISSWAALNYYKMTEQLPFTLHVVTSRRRKRKIIFYRNVKIEFIVVKKDSFCGFQRVIYQGNEIFIAEKEKAIIDGLIAKKMSIGEAIEIIKNNKRKMDKKKLFSYAKISNGLLKKLKDALYDFK